jgi:hypothetical protein
MPAERRPATEEDEFNWADKGGAYVRSRVEAENLVMRKAFRRDFQLTSRSVRLMHIWPTLDHGKAQRELGWQPKPIHDSIRRAAPFFRENRRAAKTGS